MIPPLYAVPALAILITMLLALIRATLGPTVFDRVLALNMFGTKTVLFIAVLSFATGRTDFLDLGLLYSLMNFIGMVALLRFTEQGTFSEQEAPNEQIGPHETDANRHPGWHIKSGSMADRQSATDLQTRPDQRALAEGGGQ